MHLLLRKLNILFIFQQLFGYNHIKVKLIVNEVYPGLHRTTAQMFNWAHKNRTGGHRTAVS